MNGIKGYISIREASYRWGVSERRVNQYCTEGRNPRCVPIALAFATFENVCYLIQNGADRFSFIFFRGFGTGAMHVLCGLIVGGGKMVRFPLIAEEITEYSLLESCFLAALKFF